MIAYVSRFRKALPGENNGMLFSTRYSRLGGNEMCVPFQHGLSRKSLLGVLLACLICILTSTFVHAQKTSLYDDLFSVTFPSEKDGWASGRWGTVLHTSDGGKTWVRQQTGIDFTLSGIFFVDPQRGWAVGDEGTIIHTADGGKTWEKQKSPVSYFLMDVYFATPQKGWIVGERTHILATTDGGKTWAVQFKDLDYILKAVSFCDPMNGWAVGEFGYIFHTKDGGTKWEQQGGFSDLSEETGELIGGAYLFDVVAIDPKTAWAVGIEGYVTKTVDGGKTWQQVNVGVPKTPLFSIAADRAKSMVIAGKGVFLVSQDKGQTWKKADVKPSIQYSWIYRIAPRGPSNLVAVGQGGAIYLGSSNTFQQVTY
jgi:photosystem II stability/assembly factor-like uncharacterized protein